MKKSILLLLLYLIGTTGFAQRSTFTLNGTINWRNDGYIYLSYQDKNGKPKLDSSVITKNTFQFTGDIVEPKNAYLRSSLTIRNMDDPNYASFFIEPADMKLEITEGDYKNFKLRGSKTQDEAQQLAKLKAPIYAEMKPYTAAYKVANDAYSKAIRAKLPQQELDVLHQKANDLRNQFDPFNARLSQLDFAFISKNPNSYLSAYLMIFKVASLPLDSVELIYNAFSPKVKQSGFGKQIEGEILKLKKGAPGAIAKVFASTDIDGRPLSLADFRGKYVLLDFWASWCVPCREGNPHLKKVYAQYKSKGFEIIGVSDDDSKPEAWKAAVAQDQISMWKHILRGLKRVGDDFDRSNDISENFGIHTLPTKILIDPNGKIIGRYGGGGESDEAMDKKLAEVFGREK